MSLAIGRKTSSRIRVTSAGPLNRTASPDAALATGWEFGSPVPAAGTQIGISAAIEKERGRESDGTWRSRYVKR
jgi:hypothetical protein